MLSAAVSVASFSVVLAETFAAVGLSSLIPAGFITLTRMTKQKLAAASTPPPVNQTDIDAISDAITYSAKPAGAAVTSVAPGQVAVNLLKGLAKGVEDLDVLLPKTATIHAEFEFHGSEAYAGEASIGCAIQVVTMKAGYSAIVHGVIEQQGDPERRVRERARRVLTRAGQPPPSGRRCAWGCQTTCACTTSRSSRSPTTERATPCPSTRAPRGRRCWCASEHYAQ